jgi:multidrug efflux system outer membrane protein
MSIAAANVEQAAGVFTPDALCTLPADRLRRHGERARTTESGATRLPDIVPNPQNAYQALLTASWELDLWGRIRRLSESGRAPTSSPRTRRGVA